MTIIKICGLRTVEHALVALNAGADYLGLIFAPSRRQVGEVQAAAIVEALRATPGRRPGLVGVFVNEDPDRMLGLQRRLGLAAVQLSGEEDLSVLDRLAGVTVFKAVRLNNSPAEHGWLASDPVAPYLRLLVDSHVPGSYGGAGVLGDWNAAAQIARTRPVLLAGGLTPDNVAEAIRQVRPWAVDVSSGIETDGVKDSAKIRAFIAAVRAADREFEAQGL
ncbi:MAG: phosphoribosylanthranilate isomerase [Roseiflexaceae bacterium]